MSIPVSSFTLKVQGDEPVQDHVGASFRVTMAAIDSAVSGDKPVTLKAIRLITTGPDSDDEDEEDEVEEDEALEPTVEMEEIILCTLVPGKIYQQPLDIVFAEDEDVAFVCTGNEDAVVYLSGNYIVRPGEDMEDEDEDDYDYSPDEDELDMYGEENDSEEDELDDIEEGKITEVKDEPSKKRSADDLDEIMEDAAAQAVQEATGKVLKGAKKAAATASVTADDVKPLTKNQKKKLKANDGKAVATETPEKAAAAAAAADTPTSSAKKNVAFAKNLEMGPTGSTASPAAASAKPTKKTLEGGVVVEDNKIGKGPQAKAGKKVGMRYIGRLLNGKVFDSSTSGKPFMFTLGKGEVIKGWDIGIAGMALEGERKITIPAELAYGKKGVPGIPPNSTLVFEVKLVKMA
ncbi:hypothetical protein SAICODRAFT_180326 [Saitoella complicata NRRL Y-17804]|nr:uncharacterized protein SAICODRAFT_180326 [Saitoella complicata NRRL Y-17804]ODQ50012.1 hypothetical protein SAICODRAFT_180326 [Saitoella complicata NRRL Y-17804]